MVHGRRTVDCRVSMGTVSPLSVLVTAGQCSNAAQIGPALDAISVPRSERGRPRKRPTCLRVDLAYGARHYREKMQRGMKCICPERLDARRHRLRKGTGFAKATAVARRHGSMPKLTKAAMSSSAPSIDTRTPVPLQRATKSAATTSLQP